MDLSKGQLDKLSDLFIDLAKGLFLASIAVPAVSREATTLDPLRSMLAGIFFTYLSLKTTGLKEMIK